MCIITVSCLRGLLIFNSCIWLCLWGYLAILRIILTIRNYNIGSTVCSTCGTIS